MNGSFKICSIPRFSDFVICCSTFLFSFISGHSLTLLTDWKNLEKASVFSLLHVISFSFSIRTDMFFVFLTDTPLTFNGRDHTADSGTKRLSLEQNSCQ